MSFLTRILGAVLLEQQHVSDAISHFRKAIFLSHDLNAYEGLAHCYLLQNQTKEAFELSSRLFRKYPVPRTMSLMATVVSYMQGRQDEAKSLLRSVLSVNPTCLEASLSLCHLHSSLNEYEDAIEM